MVDGSEMNSGLDFVAAIVREALDGPYAFLVDDLGFVPEGEIGTRENRPVDDAWQVLRRGDLTLTLALHGETASREPRLEITPEWTVWTAGEAFGIDLVAFIDDRVALARQVVPLLVEHVGTHGLDATLELLRAADARLGSIVDARFDLREDVRKRWRQAWDDLDVVLGMHDEAPLRYAVQGVATRSGVIAETVLDWRDDTATTRLRRDGAARTYDLAELLADIGADADAAALDRAERKDDAQRAAARAGIRIVRKHWPELRDRVLA
jgi:hypothetical protein